MSDYNTGYGQKIGSGFIEAVEDQRGHNNDGHVIHIENIGSSDNHRLVASPNTNALRDTAGSTISQQGNSSLRLEEKRKSSELKVNMKPPEKLVFRKEPKMEKYNNVKIQVKDFSQFFS